MSGRPLLAVLAISVLLAACGGGDPAAVPTAAPTGVVAPTPAEGSCDDLAGDDPAVLQVRDYSFDRACFAIRTGQSVSLVNAGANLHNFSVQNVGRVNTDVEAGQTAATPELLLDPGEYTFFCKYHRASGMGGELRVKSRRATNATATVEPSPTAGAPAPRSNGAAPAPVRTARPIVTPAPDDDDKRPRSPRTPPPTTTPTPAIATG